MPIDYDTAAQILFGETTPSQPTSARSMPTNQAENQMAERMFGETTKSPQPSAPNRHDKRDFNDLDDADKANRMFGDVDPALLHGDAMRNIEGAAMEQFLSTPEEAKEASEYWAENFQTFGLNSTESAAVAEIGVAAFTTQASPTLVTSWVEESRAVLVENFGQRGAGQALDDAKRFVEQFATPELRDVLISTGLGSHPKIVALAAAKARALRMAGKL